jgi:hypothetical protein
VCPSNDPRSLDNVAMTVGTLSKKVVSLESAIEVVTQKALKLEREMAQNAQDQLGGKGVDPVRAAVVEIQGRDVVYWNQVATTLYNEAMEIKKDVDRKAEAYKVLQDNHIRLGAVHRQTIEELAVLNRELALMRVDESRVEASSKQKVAPLVPVNPQGKDAIFWHQCARTLQQQYLDLSKELEEKVAQNAVTVESLKAAELVCKEKDVTISGLEDHVSRLSKDRSLLEGQLRKLFK